MFFQTPQPISPQFLIGAKDTLKSAQSPDLGPNISVGRLILSWLGLPTQTPENHMTAFLTFLKDLSEIRVRSGVVGFEKSSVDLDPKVGP